jgi:hypothetical protein
MRRLNMARRVFILSLVAAVALATTAFAAGQKDSATAASSATTGPKLTLTGPVSFTNLVHPTLKSGDKVYELLVPRYVVFQSGLKEGASVTVEGYQATNLPPWAEIPQGAVAMYVTKATIDGKDYDLSQLRGPMMGGRWDDGGARGYGRGMMGGRGTMGNRGGGMGSGWWD